MGQQPFVEYVNISRVKIERYFMLNGTLKDCKWLHISSVKFCYQISYQKALFFRVESDG